MVVVVIVAVAVVVVVVVVVVAAAEEVVEVVVAVAVTTASTSAFSFPHPFLQHSPTARLCLVPLQLPEVLLLCNGDGVPAASGLSCGMFSSIKVDNLALS